MTPCVYHYIPAATATDWRLIKIPIFWDHVIISSSYIIIAMLLNWLETLRLEPVKVP